MKNKELLYEKIRVAIKGYGVIGKRIDDATASINKQMIQRE